MEKPRQSRAGLWNISFGFFGIQIGFALQNANMSRIFQSLGEDIEKLPGLWVAAPLTGLLVQPIIGHLSDRTWLGRLGRRRPYFLAGAIMAAIALFIMPQSPAIWFAATMLWILDASLNISMEPFRAFVGDMLRKDQHSVGYAVQTAFIGAGAVVGSLFPSLMDAMGVANVAPPGEIPDTVRYAFWFGGVALFVSVLWTVITTREYDPAEMGRFAASPAEAVPTVRALASRNYRACFAWLAAGLAVMAIQQQFSLLREVLLLGALLIAYGLASLIAIGLARRGNETNMLSSIVGDFSGMPPIMKRLALVQFFSWSALFIMWINTTPIVAQYHFGTTDAASATYQTAANWVGTLFAVYNGVAAVAALTLLPWLSKRIGQARTHIAGLICGALGYGSFFLLRDPTHLIASEVLIGIFWASVLAMPYAILASSLPQGKLGIYMGLFNIFVVVPQLLVATVMGSIMEAFFPGAPIYTMAFASGTLLLAAAAMTRVTPLTDGAAR
ncbi:MFS transporter [Sphingopyxis sp. H050]|jgi:maltose/moltooligosaccharide transporter|uniref:MFS transporter n=1 Tax=Sphingopyxis sp. H050 TaxID=1759072 RepID=UPI000736D670|nr:MFS transporter [Sphingopyxis sp. H050]KTE22535.1 MFS transporter [Sphingopyxis sp. H050]